MDSLEFKNIYWNYYLQIEKDFFDTVPYCDIDESNSNSFSIKYLQLHLSICSEIDTVCKSLCKELDNSLEMSKCGINDYIEILKSSYNTFSEETVILVGYKYRCIQPWKGIEKGYIPNWWNVYNDIKHHRDSEKNNKKNYKYANQKNIIEALCALYVLLEYWAAKNFVTDEKEEQNIVMPKFKSKSLDLNKWRFYFTFMGPGTWFNSRLFFKYIEGKSEDVS